MFRGILFLFILLSFWHIDLYVRLMHVMCVFVYAQNTLYNLYHISNNILLLTQLCWPARSHIPNLYAIQLFINRWEFSNTFIQICTL